MKSQDCDLFFVDRDACIEKEFNCLSNKECISMNWVCDGEADCEDKSDEWFCGGYHCTGLLIAK